VTEETIEYCMDFLAGRLTVGLPISRHADRVAGKGLRKGISVALTAEDLAKAHLTVLRNSVVVQPFVEKHLTCIKEAHIEWGETQIHSEHLRTFASWLRDTVVGDGHPDALYWLAFMPSTSVLSYTGYDVNGYTFCTSSWDDKTCTQNCGVVVDGEDVGTFFYGSVEEIWELEYTGFKVAVFKCKWISSDGVSVDDQGFTTVDFHKLGYKTDPFILASQADQIFYISDPKKKGRAVVRKGKRQFNEDAHISNSPKCSFEDGMLDSIGLYPNFREKDMVKLVVRHEHDTRMVVGTVRGNFKKCKFSGRKGQS